MGKTDIKTLRAPQFAIQFSDDGKAKDEVQILREGNYHHQRFGKINIDSKKLNSFVENFNNRVVRRDIPVDFNHNGGEAAGWVNSLSIKNGNELHASVKWTSIGRQKIEDRQYRYTSVEFSDNYEDNETQQKFGPTLLAFGLTNTPFVKGMEAVVALSESLEGDDEMTKEEQTKLEGEMKTLSEGHKSLSEKVSGLETENKSLKDENVDLKKKLSEKDQEIESGKKNSDFNKMLADGKVVEAQRAPYLAGDMTKFAELATKTHTAPTGESAPESKKLETKSETPAQDEVLKLADELVEKTKTLSIDKAISQVLHSNKELAKKYHVEVEL